MAEKTIGKTAVFNMGSKVELKEQIFLLERTFFWYFCPRMCMGIHRTKLKNYVFSLIRD